MDDNGAELTCVRTVLEQVFKTLTGRSWGGHSTTSRVADMNDAPFLCASGLPDQGINHEL